MAGTYGDVPGHRFALGEDGTVCYAWNQSTGQAPQLRDVGQLAGASEVSDSAGYIAIGGISAYQTAYFNFIFPEPRSLRGLYWHGANSSTSQLNSGGCQVSSDSTDGLNGTWVNVPQNGFRYGWAGYNPSPNYRRDIATVNLDNVKMIRFSMYENSGNNNRTMEIRLMHMYGFRPLNMDRLAFWHPTLDQEVVGSHFDYGDQARGVTTGGKKFRIKNLSTTKVATACKVQARGAIGNDLGVPGLQVANEAGDNWTYETPTFNLNPGAISPIFQARLALTDVNLVVPLARSGRLATAVGSYA